MDCLNGAIFEDADPWHALDEILELPSAPEDDPRDYESELSGLVQACDRSGVGYSGTPPRPSLETVSSSASEENAAHGADQVQSNIAATGHVCSLGFFADRHVKEATQALWADPDTPGTHSSSGGEPMPREVDDEVAAPVEDMLDPLLEPASLPYRDLDARPGPPIDGDIDEQAQPRMLQSRMKTSLPSGCPARVRSSPSGEVEPESAEVTRAGEQKSGCDEAIEHDELVDGPSLFPDDERLDESE
ncbi:hypothetical protein BV20DRAFT_1052390 [Pilatotrama ljubarskyi]|nr:hypothetical protein BV20DRAFT_1052390 [Pilatotrama ljubarskyi]